VRNFSDVGLFTQYAPISLDPLNLMFQVLAMVIVAIGASRIYRGLVDHTALSHREAQAPSKFWDELQLEAGKVKDSDII